MTGEGTPDQVVAGDARWCVICADCLDVLPTLADGCVNLTVTSPPYNQMTSLESAPSGMWGATNGGLGMVRAWQERGYSDNMPEDEYQRWQNTIFSHVAAASAANGSLFYNHQLRWRDGDCLHPLVWFRPEGWRLRSEIVWDRMGGMMMNARMFYRQDERIVWFVKGDSWKWNQSHVGLGTVWQIARVQQQSGEKEHPVQFPFALPERCIGAASDPGDLIIDPFAGSGTTGVAALRLGRRVILIEREPKWAELCRERLQAEESGSTLAARRAGQGTLFG